MLYNPCFLVFVVGMSPYTMGLTAHGGWKYRIPTSFGINHIMNPDPYKGVFGGSNCRDCPVNDSDRTCACSGNECQAADAYMGQMEEVRTYGVYGGSFAVKQGHIHCHES